MSTRDTSIPSFLFSPWSITAALLLCVVGILAWGDARLGFPNDDVVVYAVVAKLWGMGELPYRDVVDHKPPLIYLFFRLCFWLGGLGPRALWQGFLWITGIGSAALLLGFQRNKLGAVGLCAALAYALIFITDPLGLREPAFLNTEQLASALLAIALSFMLLFQASLNRWLVFASGLTFGAAIITKQPSLLFALAFGIHLIIVHRHLPWKRLLWQVTLSGVVFGGATLLPLVAVLGWYAKHQAIQDLVFWTYSANMKYAGLTAIDLAYRQGFLHEHLNFLRQLLAKERALLFNVAVLAAPIIALVRRSWLDALVITWALCSVLTCALNIQSVHGHYFLYFQVPLALVVGSGAQFLLSILRISPTRPWAYWGASLAATAAIFYQDISSVHSTVRTIFLSGKPQSESNEAALTRKVMQEVEAKAQGGSEIFFYGYSPIALFYTNLKPVSKYIYPPPASMIKSEEFLAQLIEAGERSKPTVAFINNYMDRDFSPGEEGFTHKLGSYLHAHYEPVMDGARGRIFKLRDK